jgi:hypothetical protein
MGTLAETSAGIGICISSSGLVFLDADTLLYQFEIDDVTAFTQPWKGELTMVRSPGRIYEYACHEGNYSLANMLRGYRAAERQPAGPAVR